MKAVKSSKFVTLISRSVKTFRGKRAKNIRLENHCNFLNSQQISKVLIQIRLFCVNVEINRAVLGICNQVINPGPKTILHFFDKKQHNNTIRAVQFKNFAFIINECHLLRMESTRIEQQSKTFPQRRPVIQALRYKSIEKGKEQTKKQAIRLRDLNLAPFKIELRFMKIKINQIILKLFFICSKFTHKILL